MVEPVGCRQCTVGQLCGQRALGGERRLPRYARACSAAVGLLRGACTPGTFSSLGSLRVVGPVGGLGIVGSIRPDSAFGPKPGVGELVTELGSVCSERGLCSRHTACRVGGIHPCPAGSSRERAAARTRRTARLRAPRQPAGPARPAFRPAAGPADASGPAPTAEPGDRGCAGRPRLGAASVGTPEERGPGMGAATVGTPEERGPGMGAAAGVPGGRVGAVVAL